MWTCARCTLENEPGSSDCAVCGADAAWFARMERVKTETLARWTGAHGERLVRIFTPVAFSHRSAPGDRIVDGLFLGSGEAAASPEWLAEREITVAVNAAEEVHGAADNPAVTVHRFGVSDVPADAASLAQMAPAAVDAMVEALAQNRRVLVHCAVGASRSATLVVAFLMRARRMPLVDALELVRTARPVAYPNAGFLDVLCAMEEEWLGERSVAAEALEMHYSRAPWLRV